MKRAQRGSFLYRSPLSPPEQPNHTDYRDYIFFNLSCFEGEASPFEMSSLATGVYLDPYLTGRWSPVLHFRVTFPFDIQLVFSSFPNLSCFCIHLQRERRTPAQRHGCKSFSFRIKPLVSMIHTYNIESIRGWEGMTSGNSFPPRTSALKLPSSV